MRAIVADRAACDALRAKIDAAYGYPRCDRLSGTITAPRGVALSCPCVSATAPDARCRFCTLAETLPERLRDGTFAYPVNESKAETLSALSAGERASVRTVADAERTAATISVGAAAEEVKKP